MVPCSKCLINFSGGEKEDGVVHKRLCSGLEAEVELVMRALMT